MSAQFITLIVLTQAEWWSWKYDCVYTTPWPGYVRARFIDCKQVANKFDINKYRKIWISKDARIIDVILEARKQFPGFQNDFWTPPEKLKKKFPGFEFKISYSLYYPAIGEKELDDSTYISDLGMSDFELVVIKSYEHTPPYDHYESKTIVPVKDFSDFQEMTLANGNPKEKSGYRKKLVLNATLLYTDEDVALAQYVREHFDELHKMSGENLNIFVIEAPPKDSMYTAPHYWKNKLEQTKYMAWCLLGWVRRKPYDKTAAYEIARSLNIYPDELPCLTVFDNTDQINKVIFPIENDLPTFFRNAISAIQRSLSNVNYEYLEQEIEENGSQGKSWEKREKQKLEAYSKAQDVLFQELRKSLKQIQHDKDTKKIIYNFFGQTVFINHPEGEIQLEDFHKMNEK